MLEECHKIMYSTRPRDADQSEEIYESLIFAELSRILGVSESKFDFFRNITLPMACPFVPSGKIVNPLENRFWSYDTLMSGLYHGSPLGYAVVMDNIPIATALLMAGAKICSDGDCYSKSLLPACKSVEMVELLLSFGASIDIVDEHRNMLMQAIHHRPMAPVSVIDYFARRIDPKQSNKYMETTLIIAARHHSVEVRDVIDLLVEYGVDINACDSSGRTALMHAVYYKSINATQKLIELGADKEFQDMLGKDVYYYAYLKFTEKSERAKIVSILGN